MVAVKVVLRRVVRRRSFDVSGFEAAVTHLRAIIERDPTDYRAIAPVEVQLQLEILRRFHEAPEPRIEDFRSFFWKNRHIILSGVIERLSDGGWDNRAREPSTPNSREPGFVGDHHAGGSRLALRFEQLTGARART